MIGLLTGGDRPVGVDGGGGGDARRADRRFRHARLAPVRRMAHQTQDVEDPGAEHREIDDGEGGKMKVRLTVA